MKQQIKWLIAALALAALATPAFAVTADMTGSLSVRGIANNNFDGNDDADDHNQFADQRFRLFTSVAANENVKAVLGLEVDNVWGATSAGKEVGAMGADAKGQIEIKHLYLDFNIVGLNTNVKAGTQAFNLGRGLIINDDAAGIQTSTAFNPENTLSLYWIKTSEGIPAGGVDNNDRNDGDFYGAKFATKLGDLTLAPYAGYYKSGADAPTATHKEAGFFGVDLDGKAGAFTYGLTGVYNQWNGAANTDGAGFGVIAKGAFAAGESTTLSIEAARYGDKDNGGNLMSLTQGGATGPNNNFSEIITGGLYTTNSTINANVGGAATGYTTNFLYAKLGVAQKLTENAKISAYVMHIEQAVDPAPGVDAGTAGQELDAYFDYTIVPGLGLNLAGAYLLADNDFGDDAWKLASSLNYKF